ncbi:MAG: helix-turn-helix domain-containing protein [Proteobacteria bacterium]|nr:helix-turn-helix domain-containing protein [Pseudomonadota bacterium]
MASTLESGGIRAVLQWIYASFGLTGQKDLADLLGIRTQSISGWKKKGEIPDRQLRRFVEMYRETYPLQLGSLPDLEGPQRIVLEYEWFARYGINPEYVLHGVGQPLLSPDEIKAAWARRNESLHGLPQAKPEDGTPAAPVQAASSPAKAVDPAEPGTSIGRELAEIRTELEACGMSEQDIQDELRAWLRSRRGGGATKYSDVDSVRESSHVHEDHADYSVDDVLQSPELRGLLQQAPPDQAHRLRLGLRRLLEDADKQTTTQDSPPPTSGPQRPG